MAHLRILSLGFLLCLSYPEAKAISNTQAVIGTMIYTLMGTITAQWFDLASLMEIETPKYELNYVTILAALLVALISNTILREMTPQGRIKKVHSALAWCEKIGLMNLLNMISCTESSIHLPLVIEEKYHKLSYPIARTEDALIETELNLADVHGLLARAQRDVPNNEQFRLTCQQLTHKANQLSNFAQHLQSAVRALDGYQEQRNQRTQELIAEAQEAILQNLE